MQFERASGVLLHPTCLPGRFAVGDLGPAAMRFVDFLTGAGQRYWQVLPLGPTGYGDSPYQCLSAFAGNPLLVSPEKLHDIGLISKEDLQTNECPPADKVDFQLAKNSKHSLLQKAFKTFKQSSDKSLQAEFDLFCEEQERWLDQYALYSALKEKHGNVSWREWPKGVAQRHEEDMSEAGHDLAAEIESHKFFQFLFFKQWSELKNYCHERGIKIIGDMPIFVADDSAEVWAEPENFKLDAEGKPIVVAGVPPDYFSATGQLWGNPLFNWDYMRSQGYQWWIDRFASLMTLADVVRIDHFRGFAACWEIPYGDPTAERGEWIDAPGHEIFSALRTQYPDLPIIAEDLGVITPDVEELRDNFGFPGMRILQMAFRDHENSDLPHNHIQHSVVYTGTHDNDTAVGWFNSVAGTNSTRTAEQIEAEQAFCLAYLNSDGKNIAWDFVREAVASVSFLAVIPLQDLLGLGSNTRMNIPATMSGNWMWRFADSDLTDALQQRFRDATFLYGRGPKE